MKTPNVAAEADASTRQRVASSILEHGPSTAVSLAGRLGLTPAAVRRHLDVLLASGHLEARDQRVYGARGRSSTVVAGPASTTRPRCITVTVWAIWRTSARSCETKT